MRKNSMFTKMAAVICALCTTVSPAAYESNAAAIDRGWMTSEIIKESTMEAEIPKGPDSLQTEKRVNDPVKAGRSDDPEEMEKTYGSPEDGVNYDFEDIDPMYTIPEILDRYLETTTGACPQLMSEQITTKLAVNISKRVEWIDKDNGDAKITLQYQSNSGEITGTNDMNVILIQDKSGSMDSNYGLHLAMENEKLSFDENQGIVYYPILNTMGWTEDADAIMEEGRYEYLKRLNYRENQGFYKDGWMILHGERGEYGYQAPCQLQNHYYFLIEDDDTAEMLSKGCFVHGNQLYNTKSTDYHHYLMLNGREEALGYLSAGRRVVRARRWYDEKGDLQSQSSDVYFLDESCVVTFGGKEFLRTCEPDCERKDRLSCSMDFMNTLVKDIQSKNENNKIAYIPFWGDVPEEGSWVNYSSFGSEVGIFPDDDPELLTKKEGVKYFGLTESGSFEQLYSQIQNPFTYNGTNWTKAFLTAKKMLSEQKEEDKEKETLIVFLTDGMPQGVRGLPGDIENTALNASRELKELQGMEGVTVYACGVCVNQKDPGVSKRLNQADSTGTAEYAQTTADFEKLKKKILERINRQYKVEIRGKDGFYKDQLQSPFLLDTSSLDKSWKVLEHTKTALKKEVPAEVYDAVSGDSGITHVYVKDTNTIYWYIKDLTPGSYTDPGHAYSFKVKYGDYDRPTDGVDEKVISNEEQKLTYYSSANESRALNITINSPALLFNRQEKPGITVTKKLEGGSFPNDRIYHFVCSKEQYDSQVDHPDKTLSVTVKAGSSSGSGRMEQLSPGTYYIYEVDEKNQIINRMDTPVVVKETAEISTLPYSSRVPRSVISSDGVFPANRKNMLKITSTSGTATFTDYYTSLKGEKIWDDENASDRPESVKIDLMQNDKKLQSVKVTAEEGWKFSFDNLPKFDPEGRLYQYKITEEPVTAYHASIKNTSKDGGIYCELTNTRVTGDLEVVKSIESDPDTIWWDHGNPVFIIKVSGKGVDGKEYEFFHTYEFTKDYVAAHQNQGITSMSHTFKNIPISENYKVEEVCVSRYRLAKITGNGENIKSIGADTKPGAEFFGTYASVNLKDRPHGTNVEFYNEKDSYQWFNHTAHVENKIKKE